ncbi:MAG: cell envelope integrity protein TolA [Methylovulum sp.]|nr:cell envelope integrity protein TolA [Methylovulum sp.]
MNLKLFFVLFTAALSAGCGLIHGVTSLSTSVALIPVAIGDGVLGTNMASSARNGVEEAFKEGKLMQSDDIKNEISNSTLHTPSSIIFLDENGTALSEEKKRIVQDKWIVKTGELCIPNKFCYEIRTKNNQLLCPVDISFRKGDGAGLSTRLERQIKDDNQKLAEIERKKAEERAVQQRAEAEQKIAQQQAEAEQKRLAAEEEQCMATPKCRAKKEAEQKKREVEAQRQREQACDRLYTGKTVDIHVEHCYGRWMGGGCYEAYLQAQITGISKENGVATARITEQKSAWGEYYGRSYEKSCSDF